MVIVYSVSFQEVYTKDRKLNWLEDTVKVDKTRYQLLTNLPNSKYFFFSSYLAASRFQ